MTPSQWITPPLVISNGEKITSTNGANWQDRNIGSQVRPLMYSDACECNASGLSDNISELY